MRTILIAAALIAQPVFAAGDGAAPQRGRIAIVGADVLPMTKADRLSDHTILVDGDTIVAVGPRASTQVPVGYVTIDGRGKYLMPGLVDMHIHMSPAPGSDWDSTQRTLAISLANGVTTARVMSGAPSHPEVRAKVESGALAGPRLYLAAPAIADPNTPNVEAAKAKVKAAKADGFDLIKAHVIDDVGKWQAMIDEAKAQNIPVAGHVSNPVGMDRALEAAQQIEHLDSLPAELLPEGAPLDFGQILTKPQLDLIAKVPAERFAEVAARVRAKNGHIVPTLAAFTQIVELERPFDAMKAEEPDSGFVADWVIEDWRTRREGLTQMGFTLAESEGMTQVRRGLVRALHEANVPLMAGSDTPHPFQIWGFGLIREIRAFEDAGMSPLEALRSATVVPRDYLRTLPAQGSAVGWKANFGTIEPGARADLIVLTADPSKDLSALDRLETVVASGRLYDRARLDALLREAAEAGRKQPAPAAQAN